jgi:hypothetical protein
MSDPVTLAYIAIAATAAGGAVTAINTRNAGITQDYAAQAQAREEEMAARDQEVERRKKLISALAAQNAEAGASGAMSGVGSQLAINKTIVRDATRDLETNRVIGAETAARLRRAGKSARAQGNTATLGTLFDTVGSVAGGMGGMKQPAPAAGGGGSGRSMM